MYSVRILRRALKDVAKLPKDYTRLVGQHMEHLAENPRPADAKKLRGRGDYSLRVGVYRVLYEVADDAQVVTIYRVKHRREAYR
jgi:mRNA interferase RelE/StbE